MKNYTKALFAALLIGAAPVTVAATLPTFDASNTINIGIGGDSENYAGKIEGEIGDSGADYWLINIGGSQGTVTNYTTTYNREGSGIALYDWDGTSLGSQIAIGVDTGSGIGGAMNFALSAFLTAGSYILEITGLNGTSYSGTISAVPLPGAALLFGSALLGAGVVGRKKLGSKRSEAVAA